MTRAGPLALLAVASVALCCLWATAQADDESAIDLSAGYNVVTWNGAEPYALSNFDGTPVKRIYRWDAVNQGWLSHLVGQDDATLPELHLLPRVQYLILAQRNHTLAVPDALAGVNPSTSLHFAPPPADPLRFGAYFPNEDSPLSDLVVLRGEERRLSVSAEIFGGSGEVEVYWMIDGSLNHQGTASDDVDLLPGGHDHGRLYAVDGTGQISVQALPRVVRLPPLDLPDMTYGLFATLEGAGIKGSRAEHFSFNNGDWEAVEKALDLIADAGFELVTIQMHWNAIERRGKDQYDAHWLATFDRIVHEVSRRGLDLMASVLWAPNWAAESLEYPDWGLGKTPADSRHYADIIGFVAERWPEIEYFYLLEEPDVSHYYRSMDPTKAAADTIAGALAAWYYNPDAVILGANLTGMLERPTPNVVRDGEHWEVYAGALPFLRALYAQPGFADHVDVISYHPFACPIGRPRGDMTEREYVAMAERIHAVMQEHGDEDSQLWASSIAYSTASREHGGVLPEVQAECLVKMFEILTELDYVTGALQFRFTDDMSGNEGWSYRTGMVETRGRGADGLVPKPSYYAVRDFLRAQAQRAAND